MQREHMKFAHMDYLTKSYYRADHIAEVLPTEYTCFRPVEQVKAAPMYQEAWRVRCGAIVNMSWDEKQGAKVDFGGEALWNVRSETGWSDEFILKLLAESGKHRRTTRIDYAFNMAGWGSVAVLLRALAHGRYTTTFRKITTFETKTERRGNTIYFGSKDSENRIRVYDKGAEMGNLWLAWVRCEAQLRGEYAQNAVMDAASGIPLSSHVRTKISSSLDFPTVHWWGEMMNGELASVRQLQRKESKFEARMEQLMQEILSKAAASAEQRMYIEENWLPALASKLLTSQ